MGSEKVRFGTIEIVLSIFDPLKLFVSQSSRLLY
jgi:hypothetical protein